MQPRENRAAPVRFAFGLAMILAGVLLPCAPAHAGWKDKVGKLNRTVLSADEARKRSAAEEEEHRNKVAIRRLRPAHPMDWNADPTAVPQFLDQVNKRTGLPVYIDNNGLDPGSDELFDYTVIYFTGHLGFTLNDEEVENLTLFLKRGGTLYMDDCYLRGSAFGDSIPSQVDKLIPGADPVVLLETDPRVADAFKMIYSTAWPGTSGIGENRYWLYYLLDNRVAVFVSPNDDGCAWEVSTPPTAANPIGEGIGHGGNNYFREQVYQWTTNWILFALTN
ncbi:MAG TPA: DUF4159 domain-containing protein [Planctomycetota bacterium]|nr:DUF4159 domain-containing protein [Planctomycetota bacterium]